MPRPKHPRTDANQAQIIRELRELGFCVHDLSTVGGQVLDILVGGWNARFEFYTWLPFEIKTEAGTLTTNQHNFFREWPELPAYVVGSTEQILDAFGRQE